MTFDPLGWVDDELAALDEQGLRRQLQTHQGPQGAALAVDGNELLNFGSNDYLGLAADDRSSAAAVDAIAHEGWGAGASPLVTGHADAHRRLEDRLAEFEATEAALVFSSGFAANVGTICALVGRGDAVFGDEKNHASLIDGCRLSRAEVHVYRHRDCQHLESLLRATSASRRLIVTDALFSMDGDLAPLVALAELAERYGAMLLVDEAHATGVFGPHGRGLCEQLSVEDRVQIRVGTLSKALGSVGGFVAGKRKLIEWLINRARPYVFSTALPPAASAAAITALDIVRDEPHRRGELLSRAANLRQRLQAQGWHTGDSESQIIPLIVGQQTKTMQLAAALRKQRIWAPGIRPPSVPAGQSLLRISLSWAHAPSMMDTLVEALAALTKL